MNATEDQAKEINQERSSNKTFKEHKFVDKRKQSVQEAIMLNDLLV